jgi:hypothetical protein
MESHNFMFTCRSTTWDGSKGSDLAEQLRNSASIRSWSGDVTSLEQTQVHTHTQN